MAGKATCRSPNLVLLGTTSLYDVAPSQYNRLKVPHTECAGSKAEFAFLRIGATEGYGSYQFSQRTNQLLVQYVARRRAGRKVNSIFGEGVSPKFRKVRGALDALGLASDKLLQHGSSRVIYAVPLATNFSGRTYRCGKTAKAHPAVGQRRNECVGALLATALARNADPSRRYRRRGSYAHSLGFPVVHGARVRLPVTNTAGPLFDDN